MRPLDMLRALLSVGLCLATVSCAGMNTIEGSDSWRGSQPDAGQLRIAAEHGVKTVLCLRKVRAESDWAEEELAACRELGLNFRALNWSALSDSQAQIDALIRALQELPPPYLIHCKHGVDRTGLAAAVFRVVALGHSKRAASEELSIFTGHMPFLETRAMDRAWRRFSWPRLEGGDSVAQSLPKP